MEGARDDGVELAVDELFERQVRIEPARFRRHRESEHRHRRRDGRGTRQQPQHHAPRPNAAGHEHDVLLFRVESAERQEQREVQRERHRHLDELRHPQRHEKPQCLGREPARCRFLQKADEPPPQANGEQQRQQGREDEQPLAAHVAESNASKSTHANHPNRMAAARAPRSRVECSTVLLPRHL